MGWGVDEVAPITYYYQTFGSYFYVCLLCHAMLVDVDWIVIHTWKFESYLIMDNIKVATLIYIWVDWLRHLGNPVLFVFLEIPGYRVILLWTAT